MKRQSTSISNWGLNVGFEQIPNRESTISLTNEKDFFGKPLMNIHWAKIPYIERQSVRKVVEEFGKEIAKLELGRLKISDELLSEKCFEINDPINHHMGTTRMSESPSTGVVDKNCKVFHINNLYMAGGSVFSTSGAVNPTFSMVSLGLRLAKHLKQKGS